MKLPSHFPKHFYLISENIGKFNHATSKEAMGSKAFNLLQMAEIGLPVPPAIVIGTHFTNSPNQCLGPLHSIAIPTLEDISGKKLGCPRNPLILSVRSGAPISMPGMMETLLNIGLCDITLSGFLRQTGNPRLVWDSYRRLISTYGEVVDNISPSIFENEIDAITRGSDERLLSFDELRSLSKRFLSVYQLACGKPFPQNVDEQLRGAILAVFSSWDSEKAKQYRQINQIDEAIGTAVTIQQMVFGNSGSHSGAGVGFTRDPSTGEKKIWADFLGNAQGEDVVSGRRNAHGDQKLASTAPMAWAKLQGAADQIEKSFHDMQDFEFTIQNGELYMLQTRSGKRTAIAAVKIALDLLNENIITTEQALERTAEINPTDLSISKLSNNQGETAIPIAKAISACTGVVHGEIVFDAKGAQERSSQGAKTILIRNEAETSDLGALVNAAGILTKTGARTSHAAVVARQLGKVCLVSCQSMDIQTESRTVKFDGITLKEGDMITLDGNTGNVYCGEIEVQAIVDNHLVSQLLELRSKSIDKALTSNVTSQ